MYRTTSEFDADAGGSENILLYCSTHSDLCVCRHRAQLFEHRFMFGVQESCEESVRALVVVGVVTSVVSVSERD